MAEQKKCMFTTLKTELRVRGIPFWLISIVLIATVASWIPLAVIAKRRVATDDSPRVAMMQDMGRQPKYKEQQASAVFADGRADRPVIAGTVAVGQLQDDDHYYRGFTRTAIEGTGKWDVKFFDGYPSQVKVDAKLLARGQERYNIYCATCHGWDGSGHGPVNERATELGTPINAKNLSDDAVRERPEGHLFNTITNGIRTMPGYGAQVPVADRWAIVAYVRALQYSQKAPVKDVPADKVDSLR